MKVPLPAATPASARWPACEARVVTSLADRGVLVRAGTALGKAGALRVTYGTPAQNARFLNALSDLVRVDG